MPTASTLNGDLLRTRIPDATVKLVREASPIEAVVGEYVRLKKSGQSFFGLCPFHSEQTPSFSVTPSRGTFHCFGCNEHGDAFDFVARIERTDFRGAVENLAIKAGIAIKGTTSAEEAKEAKREREQIRRESELLADVEQAVLCEARETVWALNNLRLNVSRRLNELENGNLERWPGEIGWAWDALRFAYGAIARADTAYCLAAFSAPVERAAFALHPEQREPMIQAALERNHVTGSEGYRFEVAL
jgi:DNA primase